jgi:hypothetical protein
LSGEVTGSEIETVSSDDLVRVGGGPLAWVYERIGSLDGELGAGEAEHVLR